MTLTFKSQPEVELVQHSGTDADVVRAARVSVYGTEPPAVTPEEVSGLIRYMMTNRHGSVFEHNVFTFRIHAPIFVAREFMRHRMFSFNEESARYRELEPVFWLPHPGRPLRQEGKASEYRLVQGNEIDYLNAVEGIKDASGYAYSLYKCMIDAGIAREVARAVLPVNIYTSFYATCNARSLMHFLSLRIDSPENKVPTHPQAEIQAAAEQMGLRFAAKMPSTYWAWHSGGRVAP